MGKRELPVGRYSIGTVAQRTGLSVHTLRAWENRHGLLQPIRSDGGHRLYSEQDLRVLSRIIDLLGQGHRIGEIARIGRDNLADQDDDARYPPIVGERKSAYLHRWVHDLVSIACTMNQSRLELALDRAGVRLPSDVIVHQLIPQVAYDIGTRWATGECSVAAEHIASAVFSRRMLSILEAEQRYRTSAPAVVCACLPTELHSLGLVIHAIGLSQQGLRVHFLGSDVPFSAIGEAMDRLSPKEIHLSVSIHQTYQEQRSPLLGLVEAARASGHSVQIGGQGVPNSDQELTALGCIVHPRRLGLGSPS